MNNVSRVLILNYSSVELFYYVAHEVQDDKSFIIVKRDIKCITNIDKDYDLAAF